MKSSSSFLFATFIFISISSCKGQKSFGSDQLVVKETIVLNNIKGRIDHLDASLKDQFVYIAALENNSLEVVDLKKGILVQSISGLDEPQGVVYIPQTDEAMVANGGDGNCRFYNAQTFESITNINLGSDADDVRYDSVAKKIYVGYGEGGIAVIDALQHKIVGDAKLPGHPEGFQLDTKLNRLFVNVPYAHQIDVIDLTTMKVVTTWKAEFRSNFPMAIDESNHTIFIGYRSPAKLAAINEATGKTIAVTDLIDDIDDVYFDPSTDKLYASGGGGAINIFLFKDSRFEQIANIPTLNGARTSLLIPSLKVFILAERENRSQPAQLKVFSIKN